MSSSYTQVAVDGGSSAKSGTAPESVFIHRHACQHCGKSCEKEIAPELMGYHGYPYHPPRSVWHAVHTQSIHYTIYLLLVAIVVLLTFVAAKFLLVE